MTELLVVITIITILASLITVAAVNAMRKSREASISLEINQLHLSMEDLQNDLGSYPPNGMLGSPGTYGANANAGPNDFVRTFRSAFPRHREPEPLIRALGGFVGTLQIQGPAGVQPNADGVTGLSGAEAIYFWLGGFSADPEFPISGPGGPSYIGAIEDIEERNNRFEFDLGRLGPRDGDRAFAGRFIQYNSPVPADGGAQRQIHLWQYYPRGSEVPYMYFDASRHRAQNQNLNVNYDVPFGVSPEGVPLHAIKRRNESNPDRIEFVNHDKFQILHAGLDDAWGRFAAFQLPASGPPPLLFPTGPFVGDLADTLTNFTTGTLESAQE